jgi:hypothetical protein
VTGLAGPGVALDGPGLAGDGPGVAGDGPGVAGVCPGVAGACPGVAGTGEVLLLFDAGVEDDTDTVGKQGEMLVVGSLCQPVWSPVDH